jgi:hypothetical protein
MAGICPEARFRKPDAPFLKGMMMPFYICEHCAFETQDPKKKICERCKSVLLLKCPYCGKPMEKTRTIYCGHCGEKLKISICPIQ